MKKLPFWLFLLGWFMSQAQTKHHFLVTELEDPYPLPKMVWSNVRQNFNASFVSVDQKFLRSAPPTTGDLSEKWHTKAWRGEKVHTQALVWTRNGLENLRLSVSNLISNNGNTIAADHMKANFIRYVLTDHIGDLRSGCGIPGGLDTSLTADLIDDINTLSIDARTSRPIWLSIKVPANAVPGVYRGSLTVSADGEHNKTLPLEIEVLPHELPAPAAWSYHLDIWQNPYSVSRVYEVEPWSDAHFERMRPYIQLLADAGQKSITASIIHDPWSGQTYDSYETMIKWKKKKDGSWSFDYSVFDKWVEFMMSFGINKFINCYSMIPWSLDFYYEDEATGQLQALKVKPGEEAYRSHWKTMLVDFARHLKAKGWFDITTIAMDERKMADMAIAIAIIKEADANFNISLAGGNHPELYDILVDYCFASRHQLDNDILEARRNKGYTTTFYTCCTEPYPNTFTSSPYAESAWLSWYALNKGFDGYLRWAYNCWGPRPLQDTRVGTWLAGDAWFVYPGVRSSVRFERLIEGIQDFEKVTIMRKKLEEEGRTQELEKLEDAITPFDIADLRERPASYFLNKAKDILNDL